MCGVLAAVEKKSLNHDLLVVRTVCVCVCVYCERRAGGQRRRCGQQCWCCSVCALQRAHREEAGEEEEGGRLTIQLLAASNTHGAHTAITAAASFVKGSVHSTYKNINIFFFTPSCVSSSCFCFICFEVALFLII